MTSSWQTAGQAKIGAERDEVRVPPGREDVSAAGGFLFSDNLDLFETVSSASSLCFLVVERRRDDEEDSSSWETEEAEEERRESKPAEKQWSKIEKREAEWTSEKDE